MLVRGPITHYCHFNIVGGKCWDPTVSFRMELIDLDAIGLDEYIELFHDSTMIISYNCDSWHIALTSYDIKLRRSSDLQSIQHYIQH